jgi:hypothetical protein
MGQANKHKKRLLHVSASMCYLQGASYVLVSYLKVEMFMLSCTVSVGGLCALSVVVPCVLLWHNSVHIVGQLHCWSVALLVSCTVGQLHCWSVALNQTMHGTNIKLLHHVGYYLYN